MPILTIPSPFFRISSPANLSLTPQESNNIELGKALQCIYWPILENPWEIFDFPAPSTDNKDKLAARLHACKKPTYSV
jgi:hypothetical protein